MYNVNFRREAKTEETLLLMFVIHSIITFISLIMLSLTILFCNLSPPIPPKSFSSWITTVVAFGLVWLQWELDCFHGQLLRVDSNMSKTSNMSNIQSRQWLCPSTAGFIKRGKRNWESFPLNWNMPGLTVCVHWLKSFHAVGRAQFCCRSVRAPGVKQIIEWMGWIEKAKAPLWVTPWECDETAQLLLLWAQTACTDMQTET